MKKIVPNKREIKPGQIYRRQGNVYTVLAFEGAGYWTIRYRRGGGVGRTSDSRIFSSEYMQTIDVPPRAEGDEVGCVLCHSKLEKVYISRICVPCKRYGYKTCFWCAGIHQSTPGQGHGCSESSVSGCRNCGKPPRIPRNLSLPIKGVHARNFVCTRCIQQGMTLCRRCRIHVVNTRDLVPGDKYFMCVGCHPLSRETIWLHRELQGGPPVALTESWRAYSVELETYYDPKKKHRTSDGKLPAGWESKHDGSIVVPSHLPSDSEAELAGPPYFGDKGLVRVREDMMVIRKAGYRANRSCGLHVHIDITGLDRAQRNHIYKFCKWYEREIFQLVAPSRHKNDYCWSLNSQNPNGDRCPEERYRWLNMEPAFEKFRSVEFRLHQGITTGRRATEWVKVCLSMVENGLRVGHRQRKPDSSLFDVLRLRQEQRRYWDKVIKKFSGIQKPVPAPIGMGGI